MEDCPNSAGRGAGATLLPGRPGSNQGRIWHFYTLIKTGVGKWGQIRDARQRYLAEDEEDSGQELLDAAEIPITATLIYI